MNEVGLRRPLPDQSSGSGHTSGTPRHPNITDPILSKRVCFYKSGDPQFNGLRMVINNRSFKTFDALLDSLSKKVPLPFGVRNITTPRGVHAIYTLDELEDGKSYICSDRRKVKPINLALARKKLPPWYHARPASSRRRTAQQTRFFSSRSFHKQEPVFVRTPKRLLVFRNGDPTVKHAVVLRKRTTPTFESVLAYISETIQMHVVKLHTVDGRRVDGLPGLILCSGTVVAAGREPFKPAKYDAQKSPVPTRLPTNRINRKKKSPSYPSKPRIFSPSSERYIVNRIHNSIPSSGDLLSNHTNSAEMDSARMGSGAETEGNTCLGDGAEGHNCLLPTEDDIEKSFRVNQDGSMTVEMRVRLTLKEEETIHWTTTLTRSGVANQLNESCLSEPEAEQEVCAPQSNSVDVQSHAATIDIINKDQTKDHSDEDPPCLSNGVFSESGDEEDNIKLQADAGSPRRAPTPGHKHIKRKQASMDSIKTVTAVGIQDGMTGSYSYAEQIENGAMTEQYCMVKQSTTRPVPKPRRLGSLDANNINSRNVSTFKSAEMTQILQLESSREEVTETVLRIYEQQTCQDNLLANIRAQGMSASGTPFNRPATSEIRQLSSKNEFEPVLWRPLSASESISNRRTESMSVTSNFTIPSLKSDVIEATNSKQQFPESTRGKDKPQKRAINKKKRVLSKPKVINRRIWKLMSSGKRQREKQTVSVKTFSSAGFIKRIYGNRSKPAKSTIKQKKRPTQKGNRGSQPSDDPNMPSQLEENTSETVSSETSRLSTSSNKLSQPKGILTRQTSVRQEKESESMSLPGLNSSSPVSYKYVEKWLEKAHPNPTTYPHMAASCVHTENNTCEQCEHSGGLNTAEESQTLKAESLLETSVKLRIQSFENKSASPLLEKTTVTQQIVRADSISVTQNDTEEVKVITSDICSEENTVKLSLEKEIPSSMLLMEMPLPPPPAENIELSNSEYCVMDVSPAFSRPLHKLSSASSQTPDYLPLSISTSDTAVSHTNHTMKITASVQNDIPSTLREAPLPRTPSIKRASLVSNQSLERKMSLRKACLDKYTSCSDATSEATTSSTPINTLCDNVLPNGMCSAGTLNPSETLETQKSISDLMSNSSCCTSASPASSTSDERISSASISSSEASARSNLPFKETKMPLSTGKDASPKSLVKKVNLISSPSPERKSLTKKLSTDLSNTSTKSSSSHDHPPHTTIFLNTGIQKHPAPRFSPSTEKKLIHHKLKMQKTMSPYSQSLDMVSPPVTHRSAKKMLSRNLSSDSASGPANKTQRKTSSQRKSNQTPQSIKSTTDLDKAATMETSPIDTNKAQMADDLTTADQKKSSTGIQAMPQPLNTENQPNIKPMLDKIYYSIKSIRQITHRKRPSCLEKSNSLPDFSSHVASTFGSSSKVLLAFLSVMTLKECITNFNMDELNANKVSCAEALKMIDSLREIASIEDSQKLKCSLSDLQQSASKQLMQSWKGFQELSDTCKSRSSTPNYSESGLITEAHLEKDCGIAENVINELMDNLDLPEKLKEELASLLAGAERESDNEEDMSDARTIENMPLKENNDAMVSHPSTEDTVTIRDDTQDETANLDVRSIIKKFKDINQPKQSNMDSVPMITERAKPKPADQATEDEDCQNVVAAEHNDKQIPEDRQLYSKVSVEEDRRVNEEKQHQGNNEDSSNPERTNTNSGKKNLEKQVVRFETECKQQQMHDGDDGESGSDEEEQKVSSANNNVEEMENCKECVCSLDMGEQQNSEEDQLEVECEKSSDLSNHESHSEEEDAKQPSSNYYVELNFSRKEDITSPVISNALSNPDSLLNSKNKEEIHKSCTGLTVSVDESLGNSDVDEPSPSEQEQPEVECKELNVISEEVVSGPEQDQESVEEEEHLNDLPTHEEEIKTGKTLEEVTEQDKVSLDDATKSYAVDNTTNANRLIKSDSLSKCYRFNTDDDSGTDHCSCEERAEVEQSKVNDELFRSSNEEELSYYGKESSSEEEHANVGRHPDETCEEAPALATESEVIDRHQSGIVSVSQSVAERVSLLEKQVADAQKKNVTKKSAVRRFSQRNANVESDVEDSPSESPTSQSAFCTRSAPQSSLSFSYDSSGVITTEPEGSKVKSIREMFLAKSVADIQHGNKRFPSPNISELSELRAQTSASGGYQTQTSSDISSGEDDSAKKCITKGFVRRTIERLYGKKDANPDEEGGEIPPSVPKQKKKEHTSIFSPFNAARSKAMSELSYFNSTNALDTLSEATKCMAFNAQVGPGDSAAIDNGRWLLKENTQIRKSVSDPAGINKTFTNSPQGEGMCEDTQEHTPYSLFSTKSEEEDKKSLSRKCTYFSLPHANDSGACQDNQSTMGSSSSNGDDIADTKESPEGKTMAAPGVTDFKMMDNKVHPLIEVPPDGEVVVVQPRKGQGVVNRRLQEPDMLDLLYNFCGQHCPIL